MDKAFRRILIIKPSAMGDVVHGLPVLHGLRTVYPEAHIAWMVHPAWADILTNQGELDEPLLFDRKHFGRAGRSWRATRDLANWLIGLARKRFDLVVDLQGLFRSAFFSRVSRARLRAGFAWAREFGWVFYNRRVRPGPQAVHAVDRNYAFAGPLGFAHVPVTFRLPLTDAARASARNRLAEAGISPDRPYAVMAPGSTWSSKRWPAERFARLAEHLDKTRSMPTVLIGAPSERDIARAVIESAGCPVGNLVGRTRLSESIALLASAAAAVSNDSGPMHLAAALGRPLVAIFGPTDPRRTGPYGRSDSVVQAANDGRHRYRHDDTSAIEAVTVEMARDVLDRQLNNKR